MLKYSGVSRCQPARAGFTLIELLIVVAIIAILAAIAVPNFLEAQTRSKVSRVKADMRTADTALAAYRVDYNAYPREDINPDASVALTKLTTPVAYLTSTEALRDPFMVNKKGYNPSANEYYTLHHFFYVDYKFFGIDRNATNGPSFNAWGLSSLGPDNNDNGVLWGPYMFAGAPGGLSAAEKANLSGYLYDPSNGTVSGGDITRFGGDYPGAVAEYISSVR